MSGALFEFIRHARQKGMDHATIRVILLSAGWLWVASGEPRPRMVS
jgi:hypothetical protein